METARGMALGKELSKLQSDIVFDGDGIAIVWLGNTEEKAKTAKQFVYIKGEKETKFDLKLKFK